jgi:hypothetical protein
MRKSIVLSTIILFFAIFLTTCIQKKKITEGSNLSRQFEQIAFEKYGREKQIEWSHNKTYILCIKKNSGTDLNPYSVIEFFVFNNLTKTIDYEDNIAGATLKWISDYELQFIVQRGIIENVTDSGKVSYIYNLKTRQIHNQGYETK